MKDWTAGGIGVVGSPLIGNNSTKEPFGFEMAAIYGSVNLPPGRWNLPPSINLHLVKNHCPRQCLFPNNQPGV